MKYPESPEKFMESEIDLHSEINNLYVVTASPELYPLLVEMGTISSILGMIAHENTDVSLAAVGLLQELTDPDTISEVEEALTIIDAIIDGQVEYKSLTLRRIIIQSQSTHGIRYVSGTRVGDSKLISA